MKWTIRNHPEHGVFDSRGQAVAYAWSMTPPGKKRPKLDGEELADLQVRTSDHMRLTLQAFRQLGEAADQTARDLRRMMEAIENVVPESIAIKATELTNDRYNITASAGRRETIRTSPGS